jgi:light-regulated signal transduction histidine kinase (bacteriophytochrome)
MKPISTSVRAVSTSELDLREQIAELQIANRMLADFGALVAHDMAGALRRVTGYAELMRVLPDVKADNHTMAFVQTILTSARRLQNIVDHSLAHGTKRYNRGNS